MTLVKFMRCMTAGFILAILAIGLLPFLLVFFLTDVSGLSRSTIRETRWRSKSNNA